MNKWEFKWKDKKITVSFPQFVVSLVTIVFILFLFSYGKSHFTDRKEVMEDQVILEIDYDQDYDVTQGQIQESEFDGTILSVTTDAGEEYVDHTLFLGDSNTARFYAVTDSSGKKFTKLNNTIGVVGMGVDAIGGTAVMQFSNGLYTMPQSVKVLQPERVIITFGTNNLNGTDTDATSFIARYTKGIKAIQDAYPSVDIIVNSIPPVAKTRSYPHVTMTQIDAYNRAIAQMCKDNGWKYLNSSEVLKDAATGYAKEGYTITDGLHLSQKGIEVLFQYIRTHAWITEDDRPKPLAPIPNIIGVPDGLFTTDPLTNEEYTEDVLVDDGEVVEEVEETAEPETTPTPAPTPKPTATPTPTPTATPDIKTKEGCEYVRGIGAWYKDKCYETKEAGLAQKQADEEEAQRLAEEAQKQAEAEAQKQAEAEAQKQAELEAQQKAEEEARKQAEAEAQKTEEPPAVEEPVQPVVENSEPAAEVQVETVTE